VIKAKYKVYYEYTGPTKSDPFSSQLSNDSIRDHLARFPDELSTLLWLDETSSKVKVEEENLDQHNIVVAVSSPLDDERYDAQLKKALNGLDLFAEELNKPLD